MALRGRTAPRRRGFTLIELLMVVAIIALLISILLPALREARASGRRIVCIGNLHSMGQAALLYAESNRNRVLRAEDAQGKLHFTQTLMPGLGYQGRTLGLFGGESTSAQAELWNAIRTTRSFQCPDWPGAFNRTLHYVVNAFAMPYTENNIDRDVLGGGQVGNDGGSYSSAAQSYADYNMYFNLDDFRRFANPADYVYIAEAHQTLPADKAHFYDVFYASQLPFAASPRVSNDYRHRRGITAAFFDGSARLVPFKEMDPGYPLELGLRLRRWTHME